MAALSFLTVASLVSGYFREFCLAATFGAGTQADAYLSVMTIVRIVCDIGPSAILLAGLVPVVSSLLDGPFPVRGHLLTVLLVATLVATGLLAAGLHFAMPGLLTILAPGFDAATREMGLAITDGLVWFLPLQSVSMLFALFLNAHGRFRAAAAAPLVSSGMFVAILTLGGSMDAASRLWAATLAGPGLTALLLGLRAWRLGPLTFAPSAAADRALRSFWEMVRPVLLSMGLVGSTGLLMLCQLLVRREGSFAGEGSVAALAYAFRVYEVPVSLTANIAATLALPSLSRLYAGGDTERLSGLCRGIAEWGLLLLVPVAVLTAMEAPFLVDILLAHGRFSPADAGRTAAALEGFAPAIVLEAGLVMFYRVLYAVHRPKSALAVSLVVIVSLVLGLALLPECGVASLTLAFCGSLAIGMAVLAAMLFRQMGGAVLPFHRNGAAVAGLLVACSMAGLPLGNYPMLGGGAFGLLYLVAFLVLLPDHRTALIKLLRRRSSLQ